MTGTFTLDGELELEETTDADGNKAWQIVDANGNPRKLILGEAEADAVDVGKITTAEKPTYDVTSHGAEGNGATDDTTAIQSAIDAAVADGGGTVYLPRGTYVISDELVVGSNLSVKGDGRDSTTVETDQSGGGATFPGAMIRGTDVKDFHLEGISFVGPGIDAASGTMLYFDRSNNDNVSNVTTEGVFGEGFVGNAFAVNTPIMSYFRNLRIQKVSGSGMVMFNGGTSVNMDNCYALTCTEAGFELNTITYSTLRGCAAEGCGVGYDFDTLRNSAVIGCGAEENFYRSDSHPGIHYRFTNGSHNDLTASYARDFVDNGDTSQLTYVEADNAELSVKRFRGVYSNVAPSDDYRILNGATVDVVDSEFQGPGRTGTPAYERQGGDVISQSTDTGELSASDTATDPAIGDGLNYLNPGWPARTDAFVLNERFSGGLSGYSSGANGSGSVKYALATGSAGSVELSTGTTQDSAVAIVKPGYKAQRDLSWDRDIDFRAGLNFRDGSQLHAVVGRVTFGSKYDEHIGFATVGGDVIGTVGDGNNRTTTTLISAPSFPLVADCYFHVDSANGSVDFYVNDMTTPKGSISSGLPTGRSEKLTRFQAENPNSAVNRILNVAGYTLVNLP